MSEPTEPVQPPATAQSVAQEQSLLDEVLAATRYDGEAQQIAKRGLKQLVEQVIEREPQAKQVDRAFVDSLIAEIDAKLSNQVDAILHHPKFQKLESAWRSLKYVVDNVDFQENIRVEFLDCSKEALQEDFEDAESLTQSGFYKLVYSDAIGSLGGKPYAALFANYEFGPGNQDMNLLRKCAAVGAMAHAPFIAAASGEFFGGSYLELPSINENNFADNPALRKWQSFRETEDARYAALTVPRFLLRLPYGQSTVPVKSFAYEESAKEEHENFLWGNASFALATRIADSFAKWRWCPNIIGPRAGGTVENLPLYRFDALSENKIPTEVAISLRKELVLAEEGFIPLVFRKESDQAVFISANSCQKPKTFGGTEEGKAAEMNYRLGTQLPYMFIVSRLAHYLKVIQVEQLGSWKSRQSIEAGLQNWIKQFVANQENAPESIMNKYPLKQARIMVEDVPGQAGWYKVDMQIVPQFKLAGMSVTLSLVGKLDKD